MKTPTRITHRISFSGAVELANAESYRKDAGLYGAIVPRLIEMATSADNDHDRKAWAWQAGLYARNAARCALESLKKDGAL